MPEDAFGTFFNASIWFEFFERGEWVWASKCGSSKASDFLNTFLDLSCMLDSSQSLFLRLIFGIDGEYDNEEGDEEHDLDEIISILFLFVLFAIKCLSEISIDTFESFLDEKSDDECGFLDVVVTMGEKAERDWWKFFEFLEDEDDDEDDDDDDEDEDDEDSGGVVDTDDLLLLLLLENKKLFGFSTWLYWLTTLRWCWCGCNDFPHKSKSKWLLRTFGYSKFIIQYLHCISKNKFQTLQMLYFVLICLILIE